MSVKKSALWLALPAEHPCLIGMWCTSCCCVQTQHLSPLDSCHFWTETPLPVNTIKCSHTAGKDQLQSNVSHDMQVCAQVSFTSTGVVSGTSLRMIMHRLWFGRTFSPFSSTCTIGEAEGNSSYLSPDTLQMYADRFNTHTHTILYFPLTSQHIQDEVHVSGEDLNALHAGYSPNRDKLVTVHLGHQVQILGEVFSESQNDKSM